VEPFVGYNFSGFIGSMKHTTRIGLGVLVAFLISAVSTSVVAAASCYFHSGAVGYVCDAQPPPAMFVEPEARPDSILPDLQYGRIADNANVYSEPTMSSPIVRNVGDGYLFASYNTQMESEGRLWYMLEYNQWVREEDFTPAQMSSFSGFEIYSQPQRPFGWMVTDFAYSDAPGAEPSPSAIKLARHSSVQIYDAVVDDEGWIWYDIGQGRWMRQTYMSIIEVKPRPEEVGENEYWVEVDLYEQNFAAYEGDRMVYAGLVSSGLNRWPTNEGLFQVWDRWLMTEMSGAEGKVDYYVVEDVPHTMYFDYDIALHGAYWHDRYGYKHSHGCVNMAPRDAEWIWYWSEQAPNDLWVWVHTSDPHNYFERYDTEATFAGP
jgi:lipoprotein-anchoring transpeptidase ErfK/SrfK